MFKWIRYEKKKLLYYSPDLLVEIVEIEKEGLLIVSRDAIRSGYQVHLPEMGDVGVQWCQGEKERQWEKVWRWQEKDELENGNL